jgi:hypothetical protein
MLPHQGYSRPENPKRHGFDSSIKLSPLQNHGLSDSAVIIPTVAQILQDYVSYSSLQNYASHKN